MNRRQWLSTVGGLGVTNWVTRARADNLGLPIRPIRSRDAVYRVPDGVMPDVGCWFLTEDDFDGVNYRAFIHLVAAHSPYKLLTTSIRAPLVEVTQDATRAKICEIAEYAARRGIGLVMDLDVRLAREAFREAHPDEMQEMLRLREVELSAEPTELRIASDDLSDHYTFRTTHYIPLRSRLVRVYAYSRQDEGRFAAGSVQDITAGCALVEATAEAVTVALPPMPGYRACCMVAFEHLTPDSFGRSLLGFEAQTIRSYAEAPLAGVCKDEWGFPPCFDGNPAHNDIWFSEAMAAAYAERTGGRELVRDALLMWAGEEGREGERAEVISAFQLMCWARHVEIEGNLYTVTKEVFGPDAVVATHPTWFPLPDSREIKKNGLSWWAARRDIAQTDECTPHCCRTALAKKWGSGVWLNMYYSSDLRDYTLELWSGALGGGRINYHPIYPTQNVLCRYEDLLRGNLMRAHCRIRLLNFITQAPRYCPVATVFGHASAMNWAEGGNWDNVGLAVADAFATQGYPADLISTTEIEGGALQVDREGWVRYGPQRYEAVVFHGVRLEPASVERFIRKARAGGRTRIDEHEAGAEHQALVDAVVADLEARGEARQAPSVVRTSWGVPHAAPPQEGHSRLTDGTHIHTRALDSIMGDPISDTLVVDGLELAVEAEGLVAVRLDGRGHVEALAAGGLTRLAGGGLDITLGRPLDLALWRDASARWAGVVQDLDGPLPSNLEAITPRWTRLRTPPPLPSV